MIDISGTVNALHCYWVLLLCHSIANGLNWPQKIALHLIPESIVTSSPLLRNHLAQDSHKVNIVTDTSLNSPSRRLAAHMLERKTVSWLIHLYAVALSGPRAARPATDQARFLSIWLLTLDNPRFNGQTHKMNNYAYALLQQEDHKQVIAIPFWM